MYITNFIDLPDLVILNILRYLSPFDAIQAFYNIDTDRILNLLIEGQCFSTIHHLRLSLFNFVCDYILPCIGRKLSHLTLYDHQLVLAHEKQIFLYLSNILSLHLINIVEIIENENYLSYFLQKKLRNLTIEFINEHHIEAQAYVCEQFIFNKNSENLINCHLSNIYGIQLQHLNLFPNKSIENLTIELKELSDLHILFDNLLNIKILNIKICRWTIEDIKYDYRKLSKKLPNLIEFSLQTEHALSFHQILTIIQNLIYLKKLSFIYRNYDEHGIDIFQLESALNYLKHLIQFHFIIKFIYFNLNLKQTFENNIQFKQRWNIQTYNNSLYKNYLAYTKPFINKNYSISSDILLEDDSNYFSSITNLSLTTHTKQLSFLLIIRLLNEKFPSLNHLHIMDSFGIEENEEWNEKLLKIRSFDATDLKISNLFNRIFRSMPNLIDLRINSNILINYDLKLLLVKNKIKYLELITNNLDQINDILFYFSTLEQLIINSKKQSNQYERKLPRILFNWFQISSRLYIIHIKAHKLSDLFYLIHIESTETMHVKYSNEMLTLWK
jgi:hypothetical protein